jgi:hypothetical protein
MKRLIHREQVIDCGATTCGKCPHRHEDNGRGTCWFFDFEPLQFFYLKLAGRMLWFRCDACKDAEVKKS